MDLRVVHTFEIGTNLQNAIRLPNGNFFVSDCDGKLFLIDHELKTIVNTYENEIENVVDDEGNLFIMESSQFNQFNHPRDLLYTRSKQKDGDGFIDFIYVADTNCIKKIDLDRESGNPDQESVTTLVDTNSTPFGLVLLHDNSLLFCVSDTIFHLSSDLKTTTKILKIVKEYKIQDLTLLPDGDVWLALYEIKFNQTLIFKLDGTTLKLGYVKLYEQGTKITSMTSIQYSVKKPAMVTIGSRSDETSTTEFIELQQVHKFASVPIHIRAKEQFKIRSFLQLSESDFLAVCSNKLAIMGVRDAGSMNVAFKKNSPLSQDVYDHVQSFLPAAVAKEGGGGGGAGDDERSGSGNGKPGPKKQKLEYAYHAQQLQLRFNRALKW